MGLGIRCSGSSPGPALPRRKPVFNRLMMPLRLQERALNRALGDFLSSRGPQPCPLPPPPLAKGDPSPRPAIGESGLFSHQHGWISAGSSKERARNLFSPAGKAARMCRVAPSGGVPAINDTTHRRSRHAGTRTGFPGQTSTTPQVTPSRLGPRDLAAYDGGTWGGTPIWLNATYIEGCRPLRRVSA